MKIEFETSSVPELNVGGYFDGIGLRLADTVSFNHKKFFVSQEWIPYSETFFDKNFYRFQMTANIRECFRLNRRFLQ